MLREVRGPIWLRKRGKPWLWVVATTLLLAFMTSTAAARPGDLDPSFGKEGLVLTPARASSVDVNANLVMARSENGRIVLASGQTLIRYLPDGAVDRGFGRKGRRNIPTADAERLTIEDVAIDAHNRVIAVGTAWSDGGATNAFIARYLPSGVPDPSFSEKGDGIVRTNFDFPGAIRTLPDNSVLTYEPAVTATGVAVDAEGRIVITGSELAGIKECPKIGLEPYNYGYVARLTESGGLDPSFGLGGLVVNKTVSWAGHLASEASGNLLFYVGDERDSCDGPGYGLFQLGGEGAHNPTFGSGGQAEILPPEGYDLGLAIDGKGHIWTLSQPSSEEAEYRWFNQVIISRLRADGSVDTSFGNGGKVKVWLPGEESRLRAIAVDPRGRVLLAGQVSASKTAAQQKHSRAASMRFALVRLSASGHLDDRFGRDGRVFTAFGGRSRAVGTDLIIDGGASRILVGGPATSKRISGGRGFALASYRNGR